MPFAESFSSTLKSNKVIMLDKSRHLRKTMGGFKWSGKNQFDFPNTTPLDIKELREKLKQENKKRNIKYGIILFGIAVLSIWIILSL